MLYVYGIVDSHRFETIPGEGHEAGDIVSVSCGAFAAAVSSLSSRIIAATPQNVWRHERVLERLMQRSCRAAFALRHDLSRRGHAERISSAFDERTFE